MTPCPSCSAPMKLGKREVHAGEVSRYRRCRCGYVDRAWYQPEMLLRTETVRQRTKSTIGNATDLVPLDTIQT